MGLVRYENVSKKFGEVEVIRDVDLEILKGELAVLVGPSGCGKSTMLRLLAGLEEVSSGEIYIGERKVTRVQPKDRNISMVFQNYALYPHMTVRQNIAFGLKLRKTPKPEIEAATTEAARILGLEELLDRRPRELSGGQRQRVAMGRAIVRDPAVFLMDEPLSNLDAKLRNHMRVEIKQLQRRLAKTMIYVTHDQVEAMTMADRIVILDAGRVSQAGTPDEVYSRPDNVFVADFIGSPAMNFFPAVPGPDGVTLENGLHIPLEPERRSLLSGEECLVGVRPEHIRVLQDSEEPDGGLITWDTRIILCELLGGENLVHASLGRAEVRVKTPSRERRRDGDSIRLGFSPRQAHIFSKNDGLNMSPALES